ncbi:hypothetical protein CSKR_200162 [Clonorchis sinensis]|uniref:Uncharacterized protein n=1 Tax=Clonorchis sinensis TaxID=79923 RepID=A0A8T1LZL5_CLOSI|nr:hypothetical protein CSKR_200162 [Clonorchis sinensis]
MDPYMYCGEKLLGDVTVSEALSPISDNYMFVDSLGAVQFSSFMTFEASNEYVKDDHVVFVRAAGTLTTNAVLRHECVYYKCSGRSANRRKVQESEEASKLSAFAAKKENANRRLSSTFLSKKTREPSLSHLEHNRKVTMMLYHRLPVSRRLSEEELCTCRTLLKYAMPSCEVRLFVAEEFIA